MEQARYTYRFYPTQEQKMQLSQTFGCTRFVYNWGLRAGLDALKHNDTLPSPSALDKKLTTLKQSPEFGWLQHVSCVPLQQALRDLGQAWSNCFAGRARRPKFKRKYGAQSARYTKRGFSYRSGQVKLAKMSQPLEVRWSRPLPCEPSSCTVMRDVLGRYHISFVVEVHPETKAPCDQEVGLDLGLTHFVILSDGEKVDNPAFLKKDLKRLARAQRALSRKKKGSRNRLKAKRRVARIHAQIADKRRDFLHKLSTRLVDENQALAVEDLHVKGMIRNRRLARAISDAGWGMFVGMLEYKCAWYGRRFVKVERFYPSSKTCSSCGHKLAELKLDVRSWRCPSCGVVHDRDVNAARNIAGAAGLAVGEVCGEGAAVGGEQLRLFASCKSLRCASS